MLGINRRSKGLLARFYRMDGGAVAMDVSSDLEVEEVAAMMTSISDYCKMRGWNPGRLAVSLSDIEMARRNPDLKRVM